MRLLVVAIVGSLCAVEASLAPFITPCYARDSQCLRASTQRAVPVVAAGLPELGMEPLDPMTLDGIVADQSGLHMEFRNTVVKGLRNCEVMRVKRYSQRTQLDVKCSVTLVGDYQLGGLLLIMPIEGHGRYKIKIRDILVKMEFAVGERERQGQRYWTVENWRHSSEVLTGAEFRFQNLFGGNTQLANAVLDYANSNWRDIFAEVSPPIVEVIVSKIVSEVRKLFDAVPISDLSLD
ncbi:Protein takeout [Papilio machaon]|uniref:Protein takeout n=1 Tax=Papilio machaon TaxID=76193 RepID=A0A194RDY8_PAPMA|nr:Protein takeout [Papilio machaon]